MFIYICTSVSMSHIDQELKNLIWSSWGEGVNEKFSILVCRDFGWTKFGQIIKSVCCMQVVENGTKSLGAYKNTF